MDKRVEAFRRAVARIGERGKGRRYPSSVRAIAVEYARAEIGHGGSVAAAASDLGIPGQTLTYWLSKARSGAELVPVHVISDANSRREGRDVAMTMPNGIVISGLHVDDALALLRGLR